MHGYLYTSGWIPSPPLVHGLLPARSHPSPKPVTFLTLPGEPVQRVRGHQTLCRSLPTPRNFSSASDCFPEGSAPTPIWPLCCTMITNDKRRPLPDKGTRAARRGRKATGQAAGLTARLPKEGRVSAPSGNMVVFRYQKRDHHGPRVSFRPPHAQPACGRSGPSSWACASRRRREWRSPSSPPSS